MSTMKDTYIVDPNEFNDVTLLGSEVMKARKEAATKKTKQGIRSEFSINELKRFAQMTIDDRMKFCKEYKKGEPFDKCVCESIERWIRLFRDFPMRGSKELGKARVAAVERLFEEMKREGKIKCLENKG